MAARASIAEKGWGGGGGGGGVTLWGGGTPVQDGEGERIWTVRGVVGACRSKLRAVPC